MRTTHKLDPKALAAVARVLASITSQAEMSRFLGELLTPGEVRDITLRWKLLEMLAQGVPQRKIAEDLQISLCKITRGSRILKQKGAVTAQVLGRSASKA